MKGEDKSANDALVTTASINLTKNLVGAGIFSLPAALLRGSVIPGILTMLFVGAVQASTFVLIAFLCQEFGCKTYRGLFATAFGKRSGSVVDTLITVNGFFICVAYNILVADFLQKALEGLVGWENAPRPLLIWTITLVITLPLSHARNLSPLRYTSMLGLAIIAFVFMYVLKDFLLQFDDAKPRLSAHRFRLDFGIFSTLALCTGAFQAHYNSPRIFKELGSSLELHIRTVANSFGTAFLIYSSFAVAGLGLFGDSVLGNVLKNYPAEGNVAVLLAWLGMAFSVIFTYPLIFTTGRDALIGLVPPLQRATRQSPGASHVLITSSLVTLIACVACLVEDVSLVTGLLGATIGSLLCWIFPASVYLKATLGKPADLSPELEEATQPLVGGKPRKAPKLPTAGGILVAFAIMMIFVGTLSMVVGISKTMGMM